MKADMVASFLSTAGNLGRRAWTCLTYPKFLHFGLNGRDTKPGNPEFFQLNNALVEQKVMTARVRAFARRSFEGALTAPLGTALLAWVGGGVAGWQPAVIWFAIFCVIEFLIGRSAYLCWRDGSQKLDILTQGRRLIFLSFLIGLVWGSSVFVFWREGQIQHYLLNLTILVGVSAISISIMSPFLMATVSFYSGLLLLPLIHTLLMQDPISLKVAMGLGILYMLSLQHASVVGDQLIKDLELTVRNEMLAERLHLALDAADQDWFDLNPQSGEMVASVRYINFHGIATDDTVYDFQSWLDVIHPDDRAATQLAFSTALQDGGAIESEYRVRALNNEWLWIRSIGHVVDRDAQGKAVRVIGIHSDVTESKHVDGKIRKLAFYDQLTNLPNRRLLNDRIQHAIQNAKCQQQYGALLMLDMDDFKALNDTQGHDVGDKFLVVVARRIESCVREVDTVARQGGDEFVILLESLGERDEASDRAEAIAKKILDAIKKPYLLELTEVAGKGHTYNYHCSASIGVTLFSGQVNSSEELMKRADTAMYQAKTSGRNLIRFFDMGMQEQVTARAILGNELREAIQKNQFVLHYQPQMNEAGCITGAEALLRWMHPRHGVMPPDSFISVAEDTGLILPIGRFVMETACAQLVAWAARPETAHLTLSINVSAAQFRDQEFIDHTLATVKSSGVNSCKIMLEITESLLLNSLEGIIEKMFELKTRGISFSLDDFGTGYSSLAYLKHLPIDQLKIDKSFIRDVLTDMNDAVIVRTIIALAKSMELNIIAEGVETKEQRELLAKNGCFAYQGYLYAGPMATEELEQYMQQLIAKTTACTSTSAGNECQTQS
ncbi:putative bifunctional diguanylate cyclase/phosphodiesterase [Undibacterium curvum]|uniref:EAL domain-containing protein n=1 Tax=Undibacterium curvum TaxID=2762294 RepID=A0ABR7A1H7_9BURK|nr:GGDEF domain-containing phosphodiesterase [Undibacterium curvum]MBC3930568.1 EAL domain-containing protein [Undibacterium curvum]